jgi:predicted nucleotidyltransferase
MKGMTRLPIDPARLAAFCEANGIRKLSLFGSQLGGTAKPESDIDLLVEFYPDCIPGFFGIARMKHELSEKVQGKRVDLKTPMGLSRHSRDQVLKEASLQYGH